MKKAWRLLAGRGGTDDAVSEIEAVPEIETVPGIEVDPEIVVDSRGWLRAALSEARWVCREAVRQVGQRMRMAGLRKGGRNGGRMEPRPARKPALALLEASGAILDESPPRPSGRPGSKIPG